MLGVCNDNLGLPSRFALSNMARTSTVQTLDLALASMIEVVILGLMKSTCYLQVYCWIRLTHGLSSLELWLLCMRWASQASLCWALASCSTTMTDD